MNKIKSVDLVNKNTAGSRIKKALKMIGMIAFILFGTITILLVVIGNWLSDFNDEVYSESKFDKEIWLQAEEEYNPAYNIYHDGLGCVRGKMYYDLKKNFLKKEMTLEEIIMLLGRTSVRRIYKENKFQKECLQYHLGSCAKLGGPPDYLVFCPVENGKWAYKHINYNASGYPKYNAE